VVSESMMQCQGWSHLEGRRKTFEWLDWRRNLVAKDDSIIQSEIGC
jgi:hypothetical protein